MKVRKVRKTTSPIVKQSKILNYKVNKNSHKKKRTSNTPPQNIQQLVADVYHKVNFAKKGLTVKGALQNSRKEDKDRAKAQLKAFHVKSMQKDIFKFIVKSSGLYDKKFHQVDIKFSNIDELIKNNADAYAVIRDGTIKTQCTCGRFDYWYRYMATVGNYVLGVREHRYPKIRNEKLDGVLCKHQIRVFQALDQPNFAKILNRYIDNKTKGKQTRIKEKDVVSTLMASYRTKSKD